MKRLHTIAKILIRDLDRHFDDKQHKRYSEEFYLFMRILLQKRTSRNKVYSLCEPHIYAMAKGKDNKSYEYVTKVSSPRILKESSWALPLTTSISMIQKHLKQHLGMHTLKELQLSMKQYVIEVTVELNK